MILKMIRFKNYRNLDGVEIKFKDDCSFLVGQNNVGKSNVLYAISSVFNNKRFVAEDFKDDSKPISIIIQLFLKDYEIGLFNDVSDTDNCNMITIEVSQIDEDENFVFTHIETQKKLSSTAIKELLVIDYDSLRNPKNEINFQKQKGAAAILNYLVKKYISIDDKIKIVNDKVIKKSEKYIDNRISKILSKDKYGLNAVTYADNTELLSSIFVLKDKNDIEFSKYGYGLQYNALIVLSIFEKIITYVKKRKNETIDSIESILILDEPEIHLHPQLQKNLIYEIKRIFSGEDDDFNDLILELFGIDNFGGQIIISTHSPYILDNDYTSIIRLYQRDGLTRVVSTNDLVLTNGEKKQLYVQYAVVKEVVFSNAAIIAEGDTEYWTFPKFAEMMGINFNQYGIMMVSADGGDSIPPFMKLLRKLEIECVGFLDKDKFGSVPTDPDLYYTSEICFEYDLVSKLVKSSRYDIIENIINGFESSGMDYMMQQTKLEKSKKTFRKKFRITGNVRLSDLTQGDRFYVFVIASWFSLKKGSVFSNYISDKLDESLIPTSIKRVIKAIYKKVK